MSVCLRLVADQCRHSAECGVMQHDGRQSEYQTRNSGSENACTGRGALRGTSLEPSNRAPPAPSRAPQPRGTARTRVHCSTYPASPAPQTSHLAFAARCARGLLQGYVRAPEALGMRVYAPREAAAALSRGAQAAGVPTRGVLREPAGGVAPERLRATCILWTAAAPLAAPPPLVSACIRSRQRTPRPSRVPHRCGVECGQARRCRFACRRADASRACPAAAAFHPFGTASRPVDVPLVHLLPLFCSPCRRTASWPTRSHGS